MVRERSKWWVGKGWGWVRRGDKAFFLRGWKGPVGTRRGGVKGT